MSQALDSIPDLGESLHSLTDFKRIHVRRVVEACNGDLDRAATLLAVTPAEVVKWLEASTREHEATP